jgi:pimeloyl-ACP methyl ester carboxylesterase
MLRRAGRAARCAQDGGYSAGRMPFADINGQRIRFEDTGGDGMPVVLAHGFLMDREMFAPQVKALSPDRVRALI